MPKPDAGNAAEVEDKEDEDNKAEADGFGEATEGEEPVDAVSSY